MVFGQTEKFLIPVWCRDWMEAQPPAKETENSLLIRLQMLKGQEGKPEAPSQVVSERVQGRWAWVGRGDPASPVDLTASTGPLPWGRQSRWAQGQLPQGKATSHPTSGSTQCSELQNKWNWFTLPAPGGRSRAQHYREEKAIPEKFRA